MKIDDNNRRRRMHSLTREEFFERIQKPQDCWLYNGAREINGYGYLKNPFGDQPKYITAHRAAWIYTNGPIPDGMRVLHRCDIRGCVNPSHLFLGTDADNAEDMRRKGRDKSVGEKNWGAVLREYEVLEIRAAYWCKGRQSNLDELQAKYPHASRGAIYAAARGKSWRHLNAATAQASASNRGA